jgi:hypothetical protein
MAEETRVFTRRDPRRKLGLAALALSVIGGAAFLGLVAVVGILGRALGSPTGEVDSPGLALLLLPLQAVCFLAVFAALGLSAVALVRPGKEWPLPVAAWIVGAAALWFAGAQEVVWTPLGGGADPARVPPEAAALDAADPGAGARQYGPFGPAVAPRPGMGQVEPVGPEGIEERMMEEAFAGPGALPEEGFGAPPARPMRSSPQTAATPSPSRGPSARRRNGPRTAWRTPASRCSPPRIPSP